MENRGCLTLLVLLVSLLDRRVQGETSIWTARNLSQPEAQTALGQCDLQVTGVLGLHCCVAHCERRATPCAGVLYCDDVTPFCCLLAPNSTSSDVTGSSAVQTSSCHEVTSLSYQQNDVTADVTTESTSGSTKADGSASTPNAGSSDATSAYVTSANDPMDSSTTDVSMDTTTTTTAETTTEFTGTTISLVHVALTGECGGHVVCTLTPNTECREGTCQCAIGYHPDFGANICATSCSAYSDEFYSVPDFYLDQNNYKSFEGLNSNKCNARCRNDPLCRTYEHSQHWCHLQNVTKLSRLADWRHHARPGYITYFQRFCQPNAGVIEELTTPGELTTAELTTPELTTPELSTPGDLTTAELTTAQLTTAASDAETSTTQGTK